LNKVYAITEWLLRLVFVPLGKAEWVNKDTAGAVLGILVVTAIVMTVLALSGCYGGAIYAKPYHHNSSISENDDANTSDRWGICEMHYLGPQKYAPQMQVCIDREWTKKPVFGHESPDIVGDVQIVQPLYMWGRR
jgi:hypothetical protein